MSRPCAKLAPCVAGEVSPWPGLPYSLHRRRTGRSYGRPMRKTRAQPLAPWFLVKVCTLKQQNRIQTAIFVPVLRFCVFVNKQKTSPPAASAPAGLPGTLGSRPRSFVTSPGSRWARWGSLGVAIATRNSKILHKGGFSLSFVNK